MQNYNFAAIFKNSMVISLEYFGRFLDKKSNLQALFYLKTKIIYLCTIFVNMLLSIKKKRNIEHAMIFVYCMLLS